MAVEFHEVFCRMLGKYTLHAPKWQERSLAEGYEKLLPDILWGQSMPGSSHSKVLRRCVSF